MLQKLTAKLYLDNKEKWRVKFDTSKPHEKGDVVPPGICTAFQKVEHDQKSCGVTKKDGTITCVQVGDKLFSDISSYPAAKKQGQGQSILPQQLHSSFSSNTTTSATNSWSSSQVLADIDYSKTCSQVAWQCAVKGAMLGKDYKKSAKNLPMMIRHNGLGACLAFIGKQKEDSPYYQLLFEHLTGRLTILEPALDGGDFVENFRIKLNSFRTKELTKDVIAFLGWLIRYAGGLTVDNKSKTHD